MIDVRGARSDDLSYLIDIDVKCFQHTWLDEDWQNLWDSKLAHILVACFNDEPIGFLAWELDEYQDQGTLHVYKIGVKPHFRGHNLGKRLLAEIYELVIKPNNLRYMTIPVPISMTHGDNNCVGWLQKMGFKADTIIGTEKFCGVEEDIIRFVREMP